MNCQAVLFDFDGIVVDSEPMHHRAFARVFDPINLTVSWERYLDYYAGFDDRDVIRERFKEAGRELDEVTMMRIMREKANSFVDLVEQDGVVPYPGVVTLIRTLRSDDLPLAISSGALRSDIEPILRQLRMQDCFDTLVTADQVKVSKPDPESYRVAFERLRDVHPGRVTDPACCVAVEDTPAGIRSARGAGLKVLAVTNTYSADALAEAHRIVSSLEQVDRSSFDRF